MNKVEKPFNLVVDLMGREDFRKYVLDLKNIIFTDLDLDFRPNVRDFLQENYPFLSDIVRDGIIKFFYSSLSLAYDQGGLAACNIILRHLSEEGDK